MWLDDTDQSLLSLMKNQQIIVGLRSLLLPYRCVIYIKQTTTKRK